MNIKDKNELEIEEIVEEVEKLPHEKRQVVLQKLEIYQGDLPHPDILKGYNSLYPDAAQKIIDNYFYNNSLIVIYEYVKLFL